MNTPIHHSAGAFGPEVADARALALALIPAGTPDGKPLADRLAALIAIACASSATTLNRAGIREAAERAYAAGATPDEIHEAVMLVAAVGVHALHEGTRVVADVLRGHRADPRLEGEPSPEAAERLAVLNDPYWQRLDAEMPGFIDALARLSPAMFDAFRDFCSVPWRSGVLPAREKELIYVSVDAMPTHRFLPGLRFHVENALALGASPAEIVGALDIAAAAGPAWGIPAEP